MRERSSDGDVLVVGAGLAGLSCAIEYLENGGKGRVTILEALKRENELHPGRPGAGLCSGSGGLGKAMLEQVGWKLPEEVVMANIKQATLRGPTESVTIDGGLVGLDGQAIGVVNSKHKFGDWLLDRALKLGAEYRPGFRVKSMKRWPSGNWEISPNESEDWHKMAPVYGRFLVGADGPLSTVATQCFNAPMYDPKDCFTASEVYLHTPSHPNDTILLDFIPSRCAGYYWKFPASKNGDGLTKIGMGSTMDRRINPSRETDWYRQREAQATGDNGYLGKPVRYIGGKISGSKPLPVVCDPKLNVAVAGEAGRMVMASIGAGDSMAVESGRILGMNLAHGRPEEYQRHYQHEMRPYLRRHYKVKNALLSLSDKQIDRSIRLLRNYRPKSTNTRKEVIRLMRWMVLHDPFMVGRAAFQALLP